MRGSRARQIRRFTQALQEAGIIPTVIVPEKARRLWWRPSTWKPKDPVPVPRRFYWRFYKRWWGRLDARQRVVASGLMDQRIRSRGKV